MSETRMGEHGAETPKSLAALLNDAALRRVFDALQAKDEETRAVGGAVRDALLGRPVEEIDLATTLLPRAVISRAEAAGLRAIPTGIDHGTITILACGRPFEITTLREDVATDGRHATVKFGRDFEADALRRDFTINSLSLSRSGTLFDYAGGIEDIKKRRVRFIGDPMRRIAEDYLRILRFFRFSAEFADGQLDAEGRLAALRQRHGLSRLSRERIRAELLKLLCARRAAEIVAEMSGDGLLHPLLGLVPNAARLARVARLASSSAKDPLLRLAALCVHVPEDAERLRDRLRLSNADAGRLEAAARALIPLHGRDEPPGAHELRIMLYRHGRQAAMDAMVLGEIGSRSGNEAAWEQAREFLSKAEVPRLPFSGAGLMARGISEGRAIGAALKELEKRWIKAGFPEDQESLARLLNDTLPQPDGRGPG